MLKLKDFTSQTCVGFHDTIRNHNNNNIQHVTDEKTSKMLAHAHTHTPNYCIVYISIYHRMY